MATVVSMPVALSSTAAATTLDLESANIVSIGGDYGEGTGQVNFYNRESGNALLIFSSRHGVKAYVSGKVVVDGSVDTDCGRMTDNYTGSAKKVFKGASCVGLPHPPIGTPSGMEFRICKDQLGPDPCGPWSAKSH
ncbi:hypothetical protein AB5J62_19405 [Amycolatopsis sp. cg5]|uniref:hypothetical protein n=1 Tax=Amycolatopsis sp. cg5 TaxID=3238802 RepID=UPI0035259394